jgi:murein DD-endopeptidase MepM/ murein hydrolase activator NlpD
MSPSTRRHATLAVCVTVLLATVAGPAMGSPFDSAKMRRERLAHRISRERDRGHEEERALRSRIALLRRLVLAAPPRKLGVSLGQWRNARKAMLSLRQRAVSQLRTLKKRQRREIAELGRRRGVVLAWIDQYALFHACPVRGPHIVNDDFGVVVTKPDVPTHIHMGNDITAATWTPVVAPFPGIATAVPNPLGGLAVKVYGENGYVYNAHFVAYGRLGPVHTGTVIGYVGSSGDAGGPHLHFEWHPGNGPAVDPHPYLMAVC